MRVVSTFFHSSSVLHSVKAKLDDTGIEYLVVSKPSRLEVFALLQEGLKLQCSLDIWGAVSSLKVIPHEDAPDTLLVTTETPDPLVMLLEYIPGRDGGGASLQEYNHASLHSAFSRTMEDFDGAIVHPGGDVAVVATYVGKLKALILKGSPRKIIKSEFDCILPELNVLSMCFLPVSATSSQTYELAVLYCNYTGVLHLASHELNIQGQELSMEATRSFPHVAIHDDRVRTLVPISAIGDSPGGVLVLGGQSIFYFEIRRPSVDKGKAKERTMRTRRSVASVSGAISPIQPRAQVNWPLSDLTACAVLDVDDSRVLLGDKFGQLSILTLTKNGSDISMTLTRLGETSPAATITYLNAGVVFIGSHFGDSQIVRVSHTPDPLIRFRLDVLDTHKNLAPIMDAIRLDTDNSGQAEIVICSGAHGAGSLRIVRSGADLQELAFVENMMHVKLMWPLRSSYEASKDDILAVSTLQSTHFYNLANSEVGTLNELDDDTYAGFSHEATLALGNMACVVLPENGGGSARYEDSQHVVQVTCSGVFLINLFSGLRDSAWNADTEIVAASVNASQIAIALKGRKVVILMVKDGELLELRSRILDGGEISAITVQPYDSSQPFSHYIAVGFYESNTVSVWSISDLKRALLPPFALPHLPVSLLLVQFGVDTIGRRRSIGGSLDTHPTHLLVGLGDGNLHAFSLDMAGRTASVLEKLIPLGSTKPVFITQFRGGRDGSIEGRGVLACGTRLVVLYWENGRLKHSPLVQKGISAACPLNSKDFPLSIILAAVTERGGSIESTSLLIGRLREWQKLHIRTIPFGLDNPVRISHLPELKVVGVGCQRMQPHCVGENPTESGSFKILDDTTYEQLHHFPCEPNEEVTVVQELSLLLSNEGLRKTYLVVGTQCHYGEIEANEGRLLLFETRQPWLPEPKKVKQDPRPDQRMVGLATSFKVKGCVFAVAALGGHLAAAINESVYLFRVKKAETSTALPSSHSSIELEQLTKWTHNYIVSNMVSRGDRIYIGDTISSLSVVEWDATAQQLKNVARDYAPLWPVSIQTLSRDDIIGCNNDCNLFVFNTNATDKRLEQVGNYYLGDCVNKFIPGVLVSRSVDDQSVKPEYMFVTATGRIGVVSELDKDLSLHMTALQRNLAAVIFGPGNVKHTRWRAPKNSRGGLDTIGEASGFLDGDLLERFLDYENGSKEAQKVMSGTNEAERLGLSYSALGRVLEQLQSVH